MRKNNEIQLSDHFDYRRLLRFTIAPIGTMIFTSIYSIVDGFFVSNYVGSTAFASLNLDWPYIMLVSAVGFMFGTGGSALVSLQLGLGEKDKAREYFSMILYTMMGIGLLLSLLSIWQAPAICRMMGADEVMMPMCTLYLRINMCGAVFFMMQNLFQSFLITAEKPRLGFIITLMAGCTNMVLDWLLVGVLGFGLAGAACATIFSQMVGGIIPLYFFIGPKAGILRLGKARFEGRVIAKTCGNGASEFLSNISASIIGFLYNLQLLHYAGENGVAAYGVIMYVSFIFVAIYFGYAMGVSPLVGFNYGAGNTGELQNLFRKSLILLTTTNILMVILAEVLADPLVRLFVGYDAELMTMTVRGMRIYSIAFIIMGYNIFSSAFFTALNNGKISAILSVTRTLLLQVIMIYLLPAFWGLDGLWAVVIAVEAMGMVLSAYYIFRNNKVYHYISHS